MTLVGRPPETNYAPEAILIQLNVLVPVSLKQAVINRAEQNQRRLADEVRAALAAHVRSPA